MSASESLDPSSIPTPSESAKSALAEGAKDAAKNAAYRKFAGFARSKLPRPIYDMLFRGASAGEAAEAEVRRRLSRMLFGCVFSLVFAGLVGAVLLFVVGVVAFALITG